MSLRKPKSVVIHHGDEESDREELVEIGPLKQKSNKKKKLRNKIKVGVLDQEEASVDDVEFQVRTKPRKKTKGIAVPIFHNLDEDDSFGTVSHLDEFRQRVESRPVETRPVIVDVDMEKHDEDDNVQTPEPTAENKHVTFQEEEYISVMSPGEADDYGVAEADVDVIEDDGRLPLSEKEANMQKKMNDMEIKEALYDMELCGEDDFNDWETSKMRHGGLVGSNWSTSGITGRLPKMNLLDGITFDSQLESLEMSIRILREQQSERAASVEALKAQKKTYAEQLGALIDEVSTLH